MAAVGAMIPGWLRHGDLPPTGSRVVLDDTATPLPTFPGYRPVWVQSGTAALALALLVARQRAPHIASPRVILPAYGCPDLVAAALFAQVQPVLVDIDADDPAYDIAALGDALDANTVAVVAVNFLGIAERLPVLRDLLREHPQALLIEDNAQWFPEAEALELSADLVCLSFGRGKPVSLLGGGVLLARHGMAVPEIGPPQEDRLLSLKAGVFNALLLRRLYGAVNRNPLIGLGQTVFKPLEEIRALDARRQLSLGGASARYLATSQQIARLWDSALEGLAGVAPMGSAGRRLRLLRYPVLCRSQQERDALRQVLDLQGLGVSAMYQQPLPLIEGVADKVQISGNYRHARDFAERLLTLPTHPGVTAADVTRGRDLIAGVIESRLPA